VKEEKKESAMGGRESANNKYKTATGGRERTILQWIRKRGQ